MASPLAAEDLRRLQALLGLARLAWAAPTGGSRPDLAAVLEAGASLLDVDAASFWGYEEDAKDFRCEQALYRAENRKLQPGSSEGYMSRITTGGRP